MAEEAPYARLEAEAHERVYGTQFDALAEPRAPTFPLEIDISDPDLGDRWQAQLAQLDARLEALVQDVHTHEQHHAQQPGQGW